ncbi:TadE/TadG family type IV pilus assembly protein [Arthrobacter antibioticus]|uniref:TadE/TadG family type IV pilus assembly protein n=1 Tax=Arthrobacter sp. H35-MC1 TaxID=3046203 RepID=UPI0024B9D36C|nr:TadE family protein [Arthrobacter sp. H35-MC1]MDJ0316453.1 pilus assembly protein [Arthrobacter sp. H35-MC1]
MGSRFGLRRTDQPARTWEAGAAVVDFVLVGALVTVIFVALIQLALVLHVRNTVADAASSAARYGALGDRTAADAQERAALLVGSALGSNYVQDVSASVQSINGLNVLSVSISAPLPVLGLFGPSRTLEMTGHAVIIK